MTFPKTIHKVEHSRKCAKSKAYALTIRKDSSTSSSDNLHVRGTKAGAVCFYRYYGFVKELPGLFVAGDTKKQVLERAPAVISMYLSIKTNKKVPKKVKQNQ